MSPSRFWPKKILRFAVFGCAAFGAGGFWGFLFSILLQKIFTVSDLDALLYGALPVALVFTVAIWPKLPALFRFDE